MINLDKLKCVDPKVRERDLEEAQKEFSEILLREDLWDVFTGSRDIFEISSKEFRNLTVFALVFDLLVKNFRPFLKKQIKFRYGRLNEGSIIMERMETLNFKGKTFELIDSPGIKEPCKKCDFKDLCDDYIESKSWLACDAVFGPSGIYLKELKDDKGN